MKKERFGTLPTGGAVTAYTLQNEDATLRVMTRGATILNFRVYGREIIGGFDTLEDYLLDGSHQGALIGRVANRVGGACFTMDGKDYHLPKNDGENCLHGGDGFDHKNFEVLEADERHVRLTYHSADGEEGFPSALDVTVEYRLEGTSLLIDYTATPNGRTPIALTNHSYFNLDGFGDTIEHHVATIYADRYTEVDETLIPNGNHPEVAGTAFDFRTPHEIGERIGGDFIGYDHNFILSPKTSEVLFGRSLPLAATVRGKELCLSVYTDQPGVQFYIGNFLAGKPDFRGGVKRCLHGAFCLETQTEPDCIRHGIGFYDKGEVYRHTTVYRVTKA